MTTRREYLKALDELEGRISAEFLAAVRNMVARASVADIEAGVLAQNVEAIARAVGIGSAALALMTEAIRSGFITGGMMEAPSARIVFDIRNPRAERWIADHSSTLVTRITESQREAIRITLEAGLQSGRNPRQTALDIIGRVGANGRRSGGIVGLNDQQASFVANARAELSEPERMANYFTRARRDKRFDSIVRKAMDDGVPLSSADVDRIAARYSDSLLQLRGEAISRTESLASLAAGREQAVNQAVDEGVIASRFVTREWDATMDARTRDAHRLMNKQARPVGQPFQSPTGALMMQPGDSSLGAGGEDVINCRCGLKIRYDFIGQAAEMEANGG